MSLLCQAGEEHNLHIVSPHIVPALLQLSTLRLFRDVLSDDRIRNDKDFVEMRGFIKIAVLARTKFFFPLPITDLAHCIVTPSLFVCLLISFDPYSLVCGVGEEPCAVCRAVI